jgi:hypothetical protein
MNKPNETPKVQLSDEEIICTWMEPKPPESPCATNERSRLSFWRPQFTRHHEPAWVPIRLTLDALWEVEERLIQEWRRTKKLVACARMVGYKHKLKGATVDNEWHADAPTRIKALAAVLRAVVESEARP